MRRSLRVTAIAASALLMIAAGGCSKTITADEFIGLYTTNIAVPNPESTRLATRTYQGVKGRKTRYHYLRDEIPSAQGGGWFGKSATRRCPVTEMPADFPASYRPGDVVVDGRKGSGYDYMIQSVAPGTPPPATQPAAPPMPVGGVVPVAPAGK